jgi:hypothetical protein
VRRKNLDGLAAYLGISRDLPGPFTVDDRLGSRGLVYRVRRDVDAPGARMSDAEASGYLLIAGGLIWVAVGIVGLVRLNRRGHEP